MRFRQVHLDFHTSEKIEGIGEKFDAKQFQEALIAGNVDSITLFSKCHHGWAYHPSEANEIHPNLQFDLLQAQIEAAHSIGVKTPVYLSAGYDEKMALRHPEWLIRAKDESLRGAPNFTVPGYHTFCLNSPYLDYLVAQVEEVCKRYDADGIFLDIVSVRPCYCANCVRTLLSEGKDPYDENNAMELAERVYANYTKRMREAVDKYKEGLPIFHNGGHIKRGRRDLAHMNTHLELESLPTGGWGYDHFPLSARYAQTLGMQYLGMTGKFHLSWGECGGFKHKNAILYETALSVANGAKCSIGDQLNPSGEMDMATYKLIGEGYSEIKMKEPWLDGVTPVADVALLSLEALGVENGQKSDVGAVRMLLECGYLFNVIDADEDFGKYKVLILPDDACDMLEDKIKQFLAGGGKILATGKSGIGKNGFVYRLGAEYEGENGYRPDYFEPLFDIRDMERSCFVFYGQGQKIHLQNGKELGRRVDPFFNRSVSHFCSHQHAPASGHYGGPGMTEGADGIYIAWSVFSDYATKGSLILKRTVDYAIARLLGDTRTIQTNLPAQAVLTLMDQKDKNRLIAHFLYASPVKRGDGVEVIEDIIPLYQIQAKVRPGRKINSVYLAPQLEMLPFVQEGEYITFQIPKIYCHQMVVMTYGEGTDADYR